jgi:phage baseplate assembly protein W
MADTIVPHLAWPLQILPDGTFATVEQDTFDDVRQCIRVLLNTLRGIRPLAPEVGVDDIAFSGVDAHDLEQALMDAESRAVVTVTILPPDGHGEQVITVDVQLAAESNQELP